MSRPCIALFSSLKSYLRSEKKLQDSCYNGTLENPHHPMHYISSSFQCIRSVQLKVKYNLLIEVTET